MGITGGLDVVGGLSVGNVGVLPVGFIVDPEVVTVLPLIVTGSPLNKTLIRLRGATPLLATNSK
jgi:hypothetical protein